MKTTYIVSGFMRSGTSMMMRALAEGGLTPVINKNRDIMNLQWGDADYTPNESGFYELSHAQYNELGFPARYEGRLIKVLFGGIPKLCAGDYKIVFMLRDPEEIRQSYEAFFGRQAPSVLEEYHKLIDYCLGILEVRKDCQYEVIEYKDVVANPLHFFYKLSASGWKIDPIKASTVVDPSLFRFRRERLVEGI